MNEDLSFIKENCEKIKLRIQAAAQRADRDPEDIRLIAVSKTVDAARIIKALEWGITDLGENRVQELCEKADITDVSCNWHMIGHLQTNKVKYILDKVAMIHSLDRLELAEEIQKRAEKAGKIIDVLVQVNIAAEDTKFGICPECALDLIKKVSKMGNIRVKGLMTIAPLAENPEDVRWVFTGLKKLLIDIREENIDNIDMDYLSMGMSNDFEVAIEEGANMVRIGTAIFGKR
ncbi:MAG: YggS family pyridoxal phosphate-dependent enzyme [Clostridiaceae bacterium]